MEQIFLDLLKAQWYWCKVEILEIVNKFVVVNVLNFIFLSYTH